MLMPTAVLIVLVLSAIAVDLSIVHLGEREVAAAADATANDIVSEALDEVRLYRDGTYVIDPALARRAAERSLAGQGLSGGVTQLEVLVDPDGRGVTVTLAMEVDRVFATALPGSHEDVTVRASAGAEVLEG